MATTTATINLTSPDITGDPLNLSKTATLTKAGSTNDLDTLTKEIYDECLDEIILGVAFETHRSAKTGLFAVLEAAESPNKHKNPVVINKEHKRNIKKQCQVYQ